MPILLHMPCGSLGSRSLRLSAPTDVSLESLVDAVSIKWTDPLDIEAGGIPLDVWMGTRVVRKEGSPPKSKNDGTLVVDSRIRDAYKKEGYIDRDLTNGVEYFYGIFPYTARGVYTYGTVESATPRAPVVYGFLIDQSKSVPGDMITYTEENVGYTPGHMDYANGIFDYGSWGDAWFIRDLEPCMLYYDGTVAYGLDKDDYNKKADGSDSDISNADFPGNAMVGIPKVYWKCEVNGDDTANFYFSDSKIDDSYHCWSHLDDDGNEIDYCYMPIYEGCIIGDAMRSLSGKTPMVNQTAAAEIIYAEANNQADGAIWYTEVFADRMLINLLLLLIGKSTNTQAVFGAGNNESYSRLSSGTMDGRGLFYGDSSNSKGVKVFGMEHWWGNVARRIAGWVTDNRVQKVKMTYGKSDGSGKDGYNLTGDGYIETTESFTGVDNGSDVFIKAMRFGEKFGMVPYVLGTLNQNVTENNHYCDSIYNYNYSSGIRYAIVGGDINSKRRAGAFQLNIQNGAAATNANTGASLSCKPTAI